jgi:hypothetical protein
MGCQPWRALSEEGDRVVADLNKDGSERPMLKFTQTADNDAREVDAGSTRPQGSR